MPARRIQPFGQDSSGDFIPIQVEPALPLASRAGDNPQISASAVAQTGGPAAAPIPSVSGSVNNPLKQFKQLQGLFGKPADSTFQPKTAGGGPGGGAVAQIKQSFATGTNPNSPTASPALPSEAPAPALPPPPDSLSGAAASGAL